MDLGFEIRTVREVIEYLQQLPQDLRVDFFNIDDPKYVIVVDEKGNARKVLKDVKRALVFGLTLPKAQ